MTNMTIERYEQLIKEINQKLEGFSKEGSLSYLWIKIHDFSGAERLQENWNDLVAKISSIRSNDALTDLWNRRILFLAISSAIETPDLDKRPSCVALIDIDMMKAFNDRFDHAFGDKMIVGIAHKLASKFHPRHWVGRISGDEFLVLLNCGLSEAEGTIQNFHEEFRALDPLENIPGAKVTLRIGLTALTNGDTLESCMTRLEGSIQYPVKDALVTV